MYFITLIDDCFDFTFIYLLKNKSDAFNMFKVFVIKVGNQFSKRIKRFHSDRGTKYDYVVFNEFYNSRGIDTSHPKVTSMRNSHEVNVIRLVSGDKNNQQF